MFLNKVGQLIDVSIRTYARMQFSTSVKFSELFDGLQVLLAGPHCVHRHFKPSELQSVSAESKLFLSEYQPISRTEVEVVKHMPEGFLNIVIPEECIVHAPDASIHIGRDVVVSSGIGVS